MATSFSGGGSRTAPEYPERTTDHRQATENFITWGYAWSAPYFVIYKAGRKPTPYRW